MPKQLFGVHVMHPMDVQSPLFNDTLQKLEQKPMTFFEDGIYALNYGLQVARANGVQATKTPAGPDAKCEVLPGVAIVYRMLCDENKLSKMSLIRTKEMPNVKSYVGLLNRDDIKEQMGILARDGLHGMETCEMGNVQMALAKRWKAFTELEQALSRTPQEFLSTLDMEYVKPALSMMYGADGLIDNDFTAKTDCDKRFNSIAKTLWENGAGLQYTSQIDKLHDKYRGDYAYGVVGEDMPKPKAQAQAALMAIEKLNETVAQHRDIMVQNALDELAGDIFMKCDELECRDCEER